MPLVKFYAGLRRVAGVKETSLNASTLQELIDSIVQEYPALREQILDGRVLRSHLILTINGQNFDPEAGLNIPVKCDDQIAIFPPIAGG